MHDERHISRGHTEGERHLPPDLVDYAPDFLVNINGSIKAKQTLELPTDEHRIPLVRHMVLGALSTLTTDYEWRSKADVHHAAWPMSAYRGLSTDDFESCGETFRSLASLKVKIPRQFHNYIHLLYEPTPPPDEDIMNQYITEDANLRTLYNTLRLPARVQPLDTVDEEARHNLYRSMLSQMSPPQLGRMPDLEYLADLDIAEARTALASLTRILTLQEIISST